jgi:nucleoside-diphosphate-sugar epimerase
MVNELQVFGGHGFIGSKFVKEYPSCIVNDKIDYTVKSKNILYFISTITNYNMKVNPYIDIETNLITLMRVLEQCKDKDVTFNFVSSWFVYGHTEMPATEESVCHPSGFYSITKRAAEELLICYCKTFNIKYRILRLSNVVGYGDPKASPKKNALQHLINEIKANNDINVYEGGDMLRDYIHVTDICRALDIVLNKGELDTIYNIGNNEPIKFIEMLEYAKKITHSKSKFNTIPQPEFHKTVQVLSMWMKAEKLKALGYEPLYNKERMIEDMVR